MGGITPRVVEYIKEQRVQKEISTIRRSTIE